MSLLKKFGRSTRMNYGKSDTTETRPILGKLWESFLPRKGWKLVDTIDKEEFPGGECAFCGTDYRYEHLIEHEDVTITYAVGVVCAERLTNDYVTPRKNERNLKSRNQKKVAWINSCKWKRTDSGNLYRKDSSVLIYKNKNQWKVKVGEKWGKRKFKEPREAKIAVFDYLNKR